MDIRVDNVKLYITFNVVTEKELRYAAIIGNGVL